LWLHKYFEIWASCRYHTFKNIHNDQCICGLDY
jgi:hypothetical protein